ncbi:MAG: AraC family transcriptional regulator [Balneolaceae bacterium]|nr:AraC family transcriptional regulator [Balneolaceae bacterium]
MGLLQMREYKEEIELAIRAFKNNIEDIHTVQEWASYANFSSTKSFSRQIKIHFGKPAIKVMTELRLQKVIELMLKSPEESLFCIARMVGLKDEKSLYDYVKYHTELSPTSLKKRVKKEKLRSEITEYNLGVKIQSVFTE